MMDTPVPIPNTEVKHHNGDDSTFVQQQLAAGSFFCFSQYPRVLWDSFFYPDEKTETKKV